MRQLIIAALWCAGLQAQSLVITSPAANQVLSGYNGFPFSVTVAGLSSATRVCYFVDGYPASQLGQNAIAAAGCSIVTPYTLTVNTFTWFNGPHQAVATVYDALGNALATSASVAFTVQNTWPVSYGPTLAVTPSTPFNSNWSGLPTVTLTVGDHGAGQASHAHVFQCFVDGNLASVYNANASASCIVPTTPYANGNHQVCWNVYDNPVGDGTNYPNTLGLDAGTGYAGQHAEGCRTVNFSNGSTPYFLKTNAHEIFTTPGSSVTISCPANSGINTDGTTATPSSGTACAFFTRDATNCPINASTGVVTVASSPTIGNCIVYAQWPVVSGSDLVFNGICASSASHPFSYANMYQLISTPGAPGLNAGWNFITHLDTNGTVLCNAFTGAAGTGPFTIGPAREVTLLISPSNVLAHFGSDGLVHSSYTAGKSLLVNWLFSTINSIWAPNMPTGSNEPPYNPGIFADVQLSGYNTFAVPYGPNATYNTWTHLQQSQFQTDVNSHINTQVANLSLAGGCPKCYFRLLDVADGGDGLFIGSYGVPTFFNPSYHTYLNQQWMATGRAMTAQGTDEVTSKFGGVPMFGWWKVGANGMTGVHSDGAGHCTINGTTNTQRLGTSSNNFALTGSSTSLLNSTYPNLYTLSGSSYPFSFTCSSMLAAGDYTDAGISIERYGNQWFTYDNVTDVSHSDAWAKMRYHWTQANPYIPISWPPAAAAASNPVVANWGGNGNLASGTNTITVNGQNITQISDYCEIYTSAASPLPTTMLSLRSGTPSFNVPFVPTMASFVETLREQSYGVPGAQCNPQLPRATLVGTISSSYGLESYDTDTVVSCVGNLITLANPHPEIVNINPSRTRVKITGSSDPNCNHDFYVTNTPTPMTMHVTLVGASFLGTGDGGTITFSDSTTKTINTGITNFTCGGGNTHSACAELESACSNYQNCSATRCAGLCASPILLTGAADPDLPKKRGKTFTISGNSLSGFNTNTFYVPLEMSNQASNVLWYRQVPSLSGTGGTITIWPDGNFVKGRNGSSGWDEPPGAAADIYWLAAMEGFSMFGFYQYTTGCNEFGTDSLIYGDCQDSKTARIFSDDSISGQHGMNAHFENGFAVPTFHAVSLAALALQAKSKYILNPHLNSPDCGSLTVECAAMSGAAGKALMALNLAQANQSVTLDYAPYLTAGQQIVRFNVTDNAIKLTTVAANTTGETLTLGPDEKVLVLFPINFAVELIRPTLSARLADVSNAAKVVVRYGYDLYTLDAPIGTVFDCGDMSAGCMLPVDLNIGSVYYRLIYLSASGAPLATGAVQTLQ